MKFIAKQKEIMRPNCLNVKIILTTANITTYYCHLDSDTLAKLGNTHSQNILAAFILIYFVTKNITTLFRSLQTN